MRATHRVRTSCVLSAAVLSGLSLVSFRATAQAEPRERDVYYGFLADGQRYGFRHVTVSRLPDGNFRYVIEERILLDLFRVRKSRRSQGARNWCSRPITHSSRSKRRPRAQAGELTAAGRVQQAASFTSN